MNLYQETLKYLEFSGPTLFNPLIREAMNVAKGFKGGD